MGAGPLIVSFMAIVIIAAGSAVAFVLYRNMLREAKNYELTHHVQQSQTIYDVGRRLYF